ncbi:carbon-nitrogen hydrolase family protein [Oricola thermophila]|uniref:Carbon-nitrogen hydrolase family protein n=1 Tax=Oricola thermophila TaxID=2742145 RepID=A0A6N1VLA7_9HYPH|nr:carbon-nitrogen hydrolase family protein [Oricola thermophila]QKV19737.1 carbon-nitrogen hydrolase family protein [Oricola thermophila]
MNAQSHTVRVASVQFAARHTASPEEFFSRVAHFVRVASEYGSDFVCFPEHFTLQILSGEPRMLAPSDAIARLTELTPVLEDRLSALARKHAVNIVGGSHATRTGDGETRNVAYVALRDGSLHARHKLHPTPDEKSLWGISGGNSAEPVETDCGSVGVMICYDSEFPELARHLTDAGAKLFFVPYCTDTRHGHFRVRYCCHARTVENQCYVVTAGLVGNVENVANLDINHAQSAILTPSDHPFARDGIAAEATENVETMIFADLDMGRLDAARVNGSVRNLHDRRPELYRVEWTTDG